MFSEYDVFINLLKKKRIEKGFTQLNVAENIGKPQSFVSKCESGQRKINVVEFIDICCAINVDPSLFIKEIKKELYESRTKVF